jgi:hypothetical protein
MSMGFMLATFALHILALSSSPAALAQSGACPRMTVGQFTNLNGFVWCAETQRYTSVRLRSVKSRKLLTQLSELRQIIEDDIRVVRIAFKKILMVFLGGIEAH